MTGGNERFWSYAWGRPLTAMPCVHRTKTSRSPVSPGVGSSTARMRTPATRAAMATTIAATGRAGESAMSRRSLTSDAAGDPVPFRGSVDLAVLGDRPAVRSHGIGHGARAVEEPLDLAGVQVDAHDLALELVGDVREGRRHRDTGWERVED